MDDVGPAAILSGRRDVMRPPDVIITLSGQQMQQPITFEVFHELGYRFPAVHRFSCQGS